MVEKILFKPAHELKDMIARQEITASELVEKYIEQIEKLNPIINAYCTTTFDIARENAKDADSRVKGGNNLPLLNGIPTSIKDLVITKGVRTTFGSRLKENHVPGVDEVAVKRLRDAGMVMLGKTNTPEYGHMAITDNLVFGLTKNPWNLERTPGGSSGGAGAACASGLSPLALGSDGGGSIRIPSCFCGLFGFKPTYGLVPRYPHEGMAYWRLSHLGPIARYVKDAALMLDAMKGGHPADPDSLPDYNIPFFDVLSTHDLKSDLKIAYSPDLGFVKLVEPEVRAIVQDSAFKFEKVDCSIEEIQLKIKQPGDNFTYLITAAFAYDFRREIKKNRDNLSPNLVTFADLGKGVSQLDLMKSMHRRATLHDEIYNKIFKNHDILVTPTLGVPAFPHGMMAPSIIAGKSAGPLEWQGFMYPFNMTGMPAASIPAGFSKDGLPVGMQIVGKKFDDALVLQVSQAFEEISPWQSRLPPILNGA